MEFGTDDDVVGAGGVVDPEGSAPAIAGDEVGEGVVHAFGSGRRRPTPHGLPLGVGHEDPIVVAVLDGNVIKSIATARPHEDAQVIGNQHGVADNVVVESEIKRYAGAGIVMEIKLRKQGVLRMITGQAVEFVVKRRQIPHGQPPHAPRGDQTARAGAGASYMCHDGIAHILDRDAVIADLRTFTKQSPEFALLM